MAKIFKVKLLNSVQKKYIWNNILIGLLYLLSVASIALSFWLWNFWIMIALVVCVCFIFVLRKKTGILKVGYVGEKEATKILKKLPASFVVIPDLKIRSNNCEAQIDHLIIGKNTVFIIETKNYVGHIYKKNETTFMQEKKVKDGVLVKKEFYSPIKQVKTQESTLRHLFRNNKIDVNVVSIVYFCNQFARLDVNKSEIPMFSKGDVDGDKNLIDYIKKYKNTDKSPNTVDCKKITDLLKKASTT